MRSNRWHVHFSITKIFTKCKIRLKNTNVLQGILDATAGRQNSDMLVDCMLEMEIFYEGESASAQHVRWDAWSGGV